MVNFLFTDCAAFDGSSNGSGLWRKQGKSGMRKRWGGGSDLIFDHMSVEKESLARQLGAAGRPPPRDARLRSCFFERRVPYLSV